MIDGLLHVALPFPNHNLIITCIHYCVFGNGHPEEEARREEVKTPEKDKTTKDFHVHISKGERPQVTASTG